VRALVTGGAGFIGSHLVDRFFKTGYEVRIVDDLDARVHPHGLPKHVAKAAEFIKGSVTDRSTWERALKGVDVVSHQAAYQDYMPDFSRFLMVNAVSTALLYEVLVEHRWRPQKVIIASSQAVYGEGQYTCGTHGFLLANSRRPEQLRQADWEVRCPQCGESCSPKLLEEAQPNPHNQYAVSKLSGEKMALGLGSIHEIPTVALRYSITQGPRQSLFNQYSGILRIFTTRVLAGEPVIIYEDGLQTRDFVHVDDVVDANFCVLDDSVSFEVFNVGSGKPTTILEYAQLMIRKVRKQVPSLVPGRYRVGDNRHSVSNVAKLMKLGWRPQRSLPQILDDFLTWVDEIGGIPATIPDAYYEMCQRGVIQPVCQTTYSSQSAFGELRTPGSRI
jgi:dTDP-L-rhamnose 4-epimerase